MIKRLYVSVIRWLRRLLERRQVLHYLESRNTGWARHIRSLFSIYDAHDLASIDLPWWTYEAAEEVESFLATRREARVFEYGTGASTLWLSKRASKVVSVEHDEDFMLTVAPLFKGKPNLDVLTVPPKQLPPGSEGIMSGRSGHAGLDFSDYASSIDRTDGLFDLIVIDGRARIACLRHAVGKLEKDGLILFDDILRRRYRDALDLEDFSTQVIFGLTPSVPYPTSTGLLRRVTDR